MKFLVLMMLVAHYDPLWLLNVAKCIRHGTPPHRHSKQGCRKVWKSGGCQYYLVGIICPGNKIPFLVFQGRKLKFSAYVWKRISWNLTKFYSFSSFRQFLFPFFLLVVWLSWNFVRFDEILFQTDAKSFSFLSWKTKKFYSQKIYF